MARPVRPPRRPLLLGAADALAIVVFVTIGLANHHKAFSPLDYARDVLPLAGGWFAAAALLRAYSTPSRARLLGTWALGIPAGVLTRALVLGHRLNGSEGAFLVVCLTVIGLLVLTFRLILRASGLTALTRSAAGAA